MSEYVVGPGDTLSGIAARHGLTTAELAAFNGITDPNRIRIGQKLLIPGKAKPGETVKPRTEAAPAPVRKPAAMPVDGDIYVVQRGDVLSVIAQNTGVSVKELMEANDLKSDRIYAGQKLVIPKKGKEAGAPKPAPTVRRDAEARPDTTVAPAVKPAPDEPDVQDPAQAEEVLFRTHVVEEGDNIYDIALIYAVGVSDIRNANGLTDNKLTPGQRLKIPVSRR